MDTINSTLEDKKSKTQVEKALFSIIEHSVPSHFHYSLGKQVNNKGNDLFLFCENV